MKKILMVIFLIAGYITKAQVITSTLSVKGNCEQCKNRIENAADIKGVKDFVWDEDKKVAALTYNSEKVSLKEIETAIAAKGYDTQNMKGDDKAYNKLPKCCRYRTEVCTDKK